MPGDLEDAHQAGVALRRVCRVDCVVEIVMRFAGGALACILVGAAVHLWWSWLPSVVSVLLATIVVGVFAVALPLRTYRAAAQDADELRPGLVVAAPRPGQIVVRSVSGAVWCWAYRVRVGMRELTPGERAWTTGRGSMDRSPALILATPVRPGVHVLWPTRARDCERVLDPQSDRDVDEPLSYEDDQPS